jgi:hypothetical protein
MEGETMRKAAALTLSTLALQAVLIVVALLVV